MKKKLDYSLCESQLKPNPCRKLTRAAIVCFIFFLVQLAGGWYSNSLALIADSLHQLTDCAAYSVALIAHWLSKRPPTTQFTFGFARVEAIGASISISLIWFLTSFLCYSAYIRLTSQMIVAVDSVSMCISASIGLMTNIL